MKIRNLTVAERLGMSESGVSLIRNGRRFPLYATMDKIAAEYGWPVEEQVKHREVYSDAFNAMLQRWYAEHGANA